MRTAGTYLWVSAVILVIGRDLMAEPRIKLAPSSETKKIITDQKQIRVVNRKKICPRVLQEHSCQSRKSKSKRRNTRLHDWDKLPSKCFQKFIQLFLEALRSSTQQSAELSAKLPLSTRSSTQLAQLLTQLSTLEHVTHQHINSFKKLTHTGKTSAVKCKPQDILKLAVKYVFSNRKLFPVFRTDECSVFAWEWKWL